MANAVLTAKKAADALALPTLAAKELLQIFSPQNKNLFEMILYPENLSVSAIGWAALDTAMTTVFIQSIDMNFFGIEYERYNHEQGAKDIVYPEEATLHLIDNEEAFVRLYLQKWMADTVALRTFSGIPGDYVFANNQDAAKKTAIIIPQMGTGLPSLCWIRIDGMRFKSMESITLAQDSGEPLIISVQVAVDNVSLMSPIGSLL